MLNLRRGVGGVVTVLLVGGMASAQGPALADMTALRLQANAGDASAQFSLGITYDMGVWVPQDDVQAVAWFRKAADRGHAAAQNRLGYAYNIGEGVPQDYVEAHKWQNLAAYGASVEDRERFAEARDALAAQLTLYGERRHRLRPPLQARDALAAKMTPQQIADAQQRATDWLAAFEQRN